MQERIAEQRREDPARGQVRPKRQLRLARGTPTSTSVLGAGTHWAPGFLIRSRDAHPIPVAVVSAVRDTGDMWWILCNGEFDTSQEVFLRQRQAGSETTQRVSLGSSGSLDTPTGQMHLYNVTSRHPLTLHKLGKEDDENYADQSNNASQSGDRNRRLRPGI